MLLDRVLQTKALFKTGVRAMPVQRAWFCARYSVRRRNWPVPMSDGQRGDGPSVRWVHAQLLQLRHRDGHVQAVFVQRCGLRERQLFSGGRVPLQSPRYLRQMRHLQTRQQCAAKAQPFRLLSRLGHLLFSLNFRFEKSSFVFTKCILILLWNRDKSYEIIKSIFQLFCSPLTQNSAFLHSTRSARSAFQPSSVFFRC